MSDSLSRRQVLQIGLSALAWQADTNRQQGVREDGLGSPTSLPPLRSDSFRYEIRDGGFAIRNGPAYFNRPLFGTNEPSMLLSGDRPAFAYFAPATLGKIGTLYIGLITSHADRWLHQFEGIDFVYVPGFTKHVLTDPHLPDARLEVLAVPLAGDEGFTVRLRWLTPPPTDKVRLIWAFGGASGYRTNKSARVDKLQLSEEDAAANTVAVMGRSFSIRAKSLEEKYVEGACSLEGQFSAKDASAVLTSPSEAETAAASVHSVALFSGNWDNPAQDVFLLVTLAGHVRLEALAADPVRTFDESLRYYQAVANKASISSPDQHLDLALKSMVIACDGSWQPPAFLHGAMSWMQHYVGWRTLYGPDVLGWHDRVATHITSHLSHQMQRGDHRGRVPDVLESSGTTYNMNEVLLDMTLHHYNWTGNRPWLASLADAIDGVITWEKRRLEVDDSGLYESCLNTWVSDSHWYNGGYCAQASAYMHQAFLLAAEADKAAGGNGAKSAQEADRIRKSINDKLWLPHRGHYAEFIDRSGSKLVHEQPELATIYHTIEFGIADPFQAYQMLRFTETQLTNETGLPNHGRLVWNSNWAPNFKGAYAHSTRDLVFAEGLNLAVAYYHAGQFDKGYDLIKGACASMYQGSIPGGLSCHAYRNGQQRRSEEFNDGISLFARVVIEGVYGIVPEFQNDVLHLSPGFPKDWNTASVHTPDVSYTFNRTQDKISIHLTSQRQVQVHYKIGITDRLVSAVLLNGKHISEYEIKTGIGRSFVHLTTPSTSSSDLDITLAPFEHTVRFPAAVAQGDPINVTVEGIQILGFRDPQQVLTEPKQQAGLVSGVAAGEIGHHTFFLQVGNSTQSYWHPVDFEILPRLEVLTAEMTESGSCAVSLRNNTRNTSFHSMEVDWLGAHHQLQGILAPGKTREFGMQGLQSLIPGDNRVVIAGRGFEKLTKVLPYWPTTVNAELARSWQPIPMESFFDESPETVLDRNIWSGDSKYAVCFDYFLAHLNGDRRRAPNSRRLRRKVDAQGIVVTDCGIPFAQRRVGNNMAAISRLHGFQQTASIPIHRTARRIYVLLSAITFPMQSHVPNARLTVHNANGTQASVELVNPANLDSGMGTFGGTYHYTSNGREMIGELPPFTLPPQPLTILRQHGVPDEDENVHQAWETSAPERPPLAAHADIVSIDVDQASPVDRIHVEVLANDVILGLFGITLLI